MKAAILTQIGKPLEIDEVFEPEMQPGQVGVRLSASGICGAQLQEIAGLKGDPGHLPRLLGHEGVGEVTRINLGGKSKVNLGDKVILHWRKGDGAEGPLPVYGRKGGNKYVLAGPLSTFNQFAIVSENRLTVVPRDLPDDFCALMGCGLSTALMTIEHEANLLMGERILIIGCGGLGTNLVAAARMRQASDIWVMEKDESKESTAMGLGATRFVQWACDLRAGNFDVAIDTTGNVDAIESAIYSLAPSGRCILVGQPHEDFIVPYKGFFDGDGKSVRATQGGGFNPSRDIPRYVRLWQSGKLDITGIITHRLPLERINEGIDLVRAGQAGRVLIEL